MRENLKNHWKLEYFLSGSLYFFSRQRRRRFFDPHISPFHEQIEIIREQRGGGKKPRWRVQKEPSSWSKLWPSPHPSKKMSPPTADMKTYPPFYRKKSGSLPLGFRSLHAYDLCAKVVGFLSTRLMVILLKFSKKHLSIKSTLPQPWQQLKSSRRKGIKSTPNTSSYSWVAAV